MFQPLFTEAEKLKLHCLIAKETSS